MSDLLLLDAALAAQLRAAGIASVDDLFALGGDATRHRFGSFLELAVDGAPWPVYLKRYHYPGWRAARGLIGRGTLWGTAPEVNEFRALTWLRAHDIPAVRPLAAASRTRAGRLVAHALLTQVVPAARDLAQRMRTDQDPLLTNASSRRALMQSLGALIGRMHRQGFVHGDCHARNILVRAEGDELLLWLLDCRRGRVGGRKGPAFDLATLDQDLGVHFSRAERRRALEAYLQGAGEARELTRRVARLRAALPPSRP